MSYHHLTPSERKTISSMIDADYTQTQIAKALGRNQSTICRELKRNGEQNEDYNPHLSNIMYWMRRKRVYRRHKRENKRLMKYVRFRLNQKWSPEQIAGHLRCVKYPRDPNMWISHETIYRYVWEDKANSGKLYRKLRRGRKMYGKRGKGHHPNKYIKDRVSIDERPKVVDERSRVGDWEGDTVYGRHRKGCFVTMVERKSSFLVAAIMPDAKAHSLNNAVLKGFDEIPKSLIQTVTVDNGKEFSSFKMLEIALDAKFYFAHPYSAWERALNENTNGLLRQFFPKKTDLSKVTKEQLMEVVKCLNNRPRKKLNYRTPREVFAKAAIALDT